MYVGGQVMHIHECARYIVTISVHREGGKSERLSEIDARCAVMRSVRGSLGG